MTRRRQFELPEEDRDFLENRFGFEWETVREVDVRRLVVLKFAVPDGYNESQADLFLRLEAGYPDSQIDMVFFHPFLSLKSGRRISATDGRQPFDGRDWQQWSRHRTPQNPWAPGIDNIERHMMLVREWLERELRS